MADDRSSLLHAYHVGLSPLIAMPSAAAVYGDGTEWFGGIGSTAAADSQAFARTTAAIFRQAYPTSAFDEERQRRLKSRDAARTRRTNENQEFNELTKLLPIPAAITGQLDKASIIRLATSYLRLRNFDANVLLPPTKNHPKVKHGQPEEEFEVNHGTHLLQALDGFAFALSADARFLYVSETVSVYVGLSQADMTGRRIFDYTHEQDHLELAEQLNLTPPSLAKNTSLCKSRQNESTHNDVRTSSLSRQSSSMAIDSETGQADDDIQNEDTNRCFCVRFKSNLTRRGTHHKCLGFKVVQITAKLKRREPEPVEAQHPQHLLVVLGLALPLPSPSINELFVDSDMFITRLTISLTITFCEARISRITNLSGDDLVNKNLYHICHALDGRKLRSAHNDLLKKGQAVTDYYRLLSSAGSYIWVQTCATVIHNKKNKEEEHVIAMNYVLGSVKTSRCAFSLHQMDGVEREFHEKNQCANREECNHSSAADRFKPEKLTAEEGEKCSHRPEKLTAEEGENPSHRLTVSTKRTLDEEESSERVIEMASALNDDDNNAPRVINSSSFSSHRTIRGKPVDMGDDDISPEDSCVTASSDRSDQLENDDIHDEPTTDAKDHVTPHKIYRPWKRLKHVEQVQESRQ